MATPLFLKAADLPCPLDVRQRSRQLKTGQDIAVAPATKQEPTLHAFCNAVKPKFENSGYSYQKAVNAIRRIGARTSKSELWQAIEGNRPNVDAMVLYGLARILGLNPYRLLDLLAWNIENPHAKAAPQDLALEGEVLITGPEEAFMQRIRKLKAGEYRELHRKLEELDGYGKVGARSKRENFR